MIVTALTAVPLLAMAQEPVRDFAQLNTRLRPGDTVWVTDAQGREIKGKIQTLAPDAITLKGGGRTFTALDVGLIRERRRDSLINGAIIGTAVGAFFGAGLAGFGDNASDSDYAAAAAFGGAFGAGIGVGIDALIPGRKLVAYRGPRSISQARLSFAPVVTPRAKGLAVAVSF